MSLPVVPREPALPGQVPDQDDDARDEAAETAERAAPKAADAAEPAAEPPKAADAAADAAADTAEPAGETPKAAAADAPKAAATAEPAAETPKAAAADAPMGAATAEQAAETPKAEAADAPMGAATAEPAAEMPKAAAADVAAADAAEPAAETPKAAAADAAAADAAEPAAETPQAASVADAAKAKATDASAADAAKAKATDAPAADAAKAKATDAPAAEAAKATDAPAAEAAKAKATDAPAADAAPDAAGAAADASSMTTASSPGGKSADKEHEAALKIQSRFRGNQARQETPRTTTTEVGDEYSLAAWSAPVEEFLGPRALRTFAGVWVEADGEVTKGGLERWLKEPHDVYVLAREGAASDWQALLAEVLPGCHRVASAAGPASRLDVWAAAPLTTLVRLQTATWRGAGPLAACHALYAKGEVGRSSLFVCHATLPPDLPDADNDAKLPPRKQAIEALFTECPLRPSHWTSQQLLFMPHAVLLLGSLHFGSLCAEWRGAPARRLWEEDRLLRVLARYDKPGHPGIAACRKHADALGGLPDPVVVLLSFFAEAPLLFDPPSAVQVPTCWGSRVLFKERPAPRPPADGEEPRPALWRGMRSLRYGHDPQLFAQLELYCELAPLSDPGKPPRPKPRSRAAQVKAAGSRFCAVQ